MTTRKRIFKAIVVLLLSFCLLASVANARVVITEEKVDAIIDKLNSLGSSTKNQLLSLLRDYLQTDETVESLKEDMNDFLPLFLGENPEQALADKGLTKDDLFDWLDFLKTWSVEDRLKLVDYIEAGETEKIMRLYEAYANAPDGDSAGSLPVATEPQTTLPAVPSVVFTDIDTHWAKEFINFVAAKGIIKGVGDGRFAPDNPVTRAEFTAMLVRLLDLKANDQSAASLPFTDVSQADWFYSAVKLGYQFGLVKGKGDRFDPNGLITREEMVVLLVRAGSLLNKPIFILSGEVENVLTKFADRQAISPWATTEVAAALKWKLINGQTADRFNPKGQATRAEAATVIFNFTKLLLEQ